MGSGRRRWPCRSRQGAQRPPAPGVGGANLPSARESFREEVRVQLSSKVWLGSTQELPACAGDVQGADDKFRVADAASQVGAWGPGK